MNNPQQTPLEELIPDCCRIQQECTIQERKLNADFSYIQENAGTLLLSGVSALLFPNTKAKSKGTEIKQPARTDTGSAIHVIRLCRLSFCGTRIITRRMGCRTPIIDCLGHPESPDMDN
ncbi:MAG: hypothetical protein V8T12_00730 [Parabacteroides johnsonii]